MKTSKKLKALKQLLELRDNLDAKSEVYHKGRSGICGYVPEFNLIEYFVTWQHFSGFGAFPVPDLRKGSRTKFYDGKENGTMWQGEYGKLRRELLDHIIKQLKSELKFSLQYQIYRMFK